MELSASADIRSSLRLFLNTLILFLVYLTRSKICFLWSSLRLSHAFLSKAKVGRF